jgi:hypothetical protein
VGPTHQLGAERGEGGTARDASHEEGGNWVGLGGVVGPAERPRPNGGGGAAAGREGKQKWSVAGPKVRMGRLAAGPVGPKVRKILF